MNKPTGTIVLTIALTTVLLTILRGLRAQENSDDGLLTRTVKTGEIDRPYSIHVPKSYDAKKPSPVVIMLHGGGGTAKAALRETGWDQKAEKEGFLALFPEATRPDPAKPARFGSNGQIWNDGSGRFHAGEKNVPDIAYLNAVIDDVVKTWSVDERRIYITGFSNGASMSFRAGAELSGRIAAIAPVAGASWIDEIKLERPIPVLYITGSVDPLNPLEGGEPKLAASGIPIGGRKKPPVRETILRWAKLIGAPETPQSSKSDNGVTTTVYAPGRAETEVVFITIDGMGHAWAGGKSLLPESMIGKGSDKISATDVIWEFFKKHPMPGKK